MSIRKLNSLPYGNCYIKDYGNVIVLISYSTPVIIVENGWLHVNGLYSATTRKHIGKFMREMGYGNYQLAKKLFTMKVDYNVETGEIIEFQERGTQSLFSFLYVLHLNKNLRML